MLCNYPQISDFFWSETEHEAVVLPGGALDSDVGGHVLSNVVTEAEAYDDDVCVPVCAGCSRTYHWLAGSGSKTS